MKIKKVGQPIPEKTSEENLSFNQDKIIRSDDKFAEPKLKSDSSQNFKKDRPNRIVYLLIPIFLILAGVIAYINISDNDDNKTNLTANELRLKELELKERELKLREESLKDGKPNQEVNDKLVAPPTTSNESQDINNSSEAENRVKTWISSLGNQDFHTAYSLMSTKIRGDYSRFSSTKGYGGITGTKIYNSYVDNKSGCRFDVIADYEAIDPYNKSGRYVQRFSVDNCDGSWKITQIKNVSINLY